MDVLQSLHNPHMLILQELTPLRGHYYMTTSCSAEVTNNFVTQ